MEPMVKSTANLDKALCWVLAMEITEAGSAFILASHSSQEFHQVILESLFL